MKKIIHIKTHKCHNHINIIIYKSNGDAYYNKHSRLLRGGRQSRDQIVPILLQH